MAHIPHDAAKTAAKLAGDRLKALAAEALERKQADDITLAILEFIAAIKDASPTAYDELCRRAKFVEDRTAEGTPIFKALSNCSFLTIPPWSKFLSTRDESPTNTATTAKEMSLVLAKGGLRALWSFVPPASGGGQLNKTGPSPEPILYAATAGHIAEKLEAALRRSLKKSVPADDYGLTLAIDERRAISVVSGMLQEIVREAKDIAADGCRVLWRFYKSQSSPGVVPGPYLGLNGVKQRVWYKSFLPGVLVAVDALLAMVDQTDDGTTPSTLSGLNDASAETQVEVSPAQLRDWLCISQTTLKKRVTDGVYPLKIESEKLWIAPESFIDKCKATAAARKTQRPATN